jgi:RNA polymerase sigma factor for flagellar operon FliA
MVAANEETLSVDVGIADEPAVKRSFEDRERLILDHLPQVKLIAKNIRERLPVSVNLEDLISAGVIGLIAAVDRFDPSRNVKLKTYAEYKIRGAILDSLRSLDWAPRGHRKHAKTIERAIADLETKLGREPSEEEIAAFLNLPLAQYHEWLSELPGLSLGSLEDTDGREDGHNRLSYVADHEDRLPSRILERAELEQALARSIDRMPKVERTVLNLYYYEQMTLREIAGVLQLHDSRISQLKTQAVLRLRAHLQRYLG